MGDNLELIEDLLNQLTELSDNINSCQNKIREYERTLSRNHEHDKKLLLDLRLKFGSKIDEAKKYYSSAEQVKQLESLQLTLSAEIRSKKEILHRNLIEKSPDDLFDNSLQIKQMRGCINGLKLELQMTELACQKQREVTDRLQKRHRDSVERTLTYFQLQRSSMATTSLLVEATNEERSRLRERRQQYADIMERLERLSGEMHEARKAQLEAERRRRQLQDEDGDCRCCCEPTTVSQYQLFDDTDPTTPPSSIQSLTAIPPSSIGWSTPSQSADSGNLFATIVSPCHSINLPPLCHHHNHHSTATDVKVTTNVTWHPLM